MLATDIDPETISPSGGRDMRFALLSCAALLTTGLVACVVPGNERMGASGNSNHMFFDNSEYIAVDNAIYDTLAERFGADNVQESTFPEKEYHHWYVLSPESFNGARSRMRVEGNAYKDSDGGYSAEIRVKEETYMEADPWYRSRSNTIGEQRWFEGGRNHKLEANIMNEVNRKLTVWRSRGRPSSMPNRRDQYRDGGGSDRDSFGEAKESSEAGGQ